MIPERVRCAHCGKMAHYEEDAGAGGEFQCHVWLCTCGWTTEWEVLDGKSCGLYYSHPDRDGSLAYWEIRHYKHAWNVVDGKIPDAVRSEKK